jgi:Notch-like protein
MKGEPCTTVGSGTPARTCIKDFCKDFFCEVDTSGAVAQYVQSNTVKTEIIKKSSAYITTWMYVLHEYRDAVGDCNDGDLTDNNASVHATDEAMAFYTGELEGQTGFNYARDNAGDLVNKVGYLMHNLADKRCNNFGTCTGKPENTSPDPSNIQGASAVNTKVAELAQQFAAEVTSTACTTAAETLKLIEAQMTVPLVQGTIRYAYKCHKSNASLKSMAEGAVFWMSIAPQVATCNPTGAAVIQAAMLRPMITAAPYPDGVAKFAQIMGILQDCYSSMGITCADVGGLIEADAGSPAKACTDPPPPAPATSTVKETTNDMPAFVLPAIIVLALLLAVFLGFCVHARAQANHFKVMYDQFAQGGGKATPGRRV